MFRPGTFVFDTRGPNTIRVQLAGTIDPAGERSPADLMERARTMLLKSEGGAGPDIAGAGTARGGEDV
jgi:hypothetical protein